METLSTVLAKNGALGAADAVGWTIRLAKRLETLHGGGEVHGSVSAEAIRVAGTAASSEGRLVDGRRAPDLAAFRSPERPPAGPGSVADDTWAVAVTLYLLLTGELPFPGATYDEVQWKSLAAPPPPLRTRGVEDAGLQAIVDRAFTLDLAARTMDVAVLRRALEASGVGVDLAALPPLDLDEGIAVSDLADVELLEETMVRSALSPAARRVVELASARLAPPEPPPSQPEPPPSQPRPPPSQPAPPASSRPPPSSRRPPSSRPAPALGKLMAMATKAPVPTRRPPPATPPRPSAKTADRAPAPPPPLPAPEPPAQPVVDAPADASVPSAPPPVIVPPPVVAAPMFEAPVAPARSRLPWVAAAVAAVVLVGVLAIWALAGPSAPGGPELATSAAPAPPAPSARAPEPIASSEPPPEACMLSLFAPDTFDPAALPDLSTVCGETDPRRGGSKLRSLVVKAGTGRSVSAGMKEWAMLGWYEMAAFAVIRGRCCPSAAALSLPQTPGCDAAADILNELPPALGARDQAKVDAIMERYTTAVRCIARGGSASAYGRPGGPQGGEASTFQRTLERALQAR